MRKVPETVLAERQLELAHGCSPRSGIREFGGVVHKVEYLVDFFKYITEAANNSRVCRENKKKKYCIIYFFKVRCKKSNTESI